MSQANKPTSMSLDSSLSDDFEHISLESCKNDPSPKRKLESMPQRILRVQVDLRDLKDFYNVEISSKRRERLKEYFNSQLKDLKSAPFDDYDQEGKVDYILLKNWLELNLRQLDLDAVKDTKVEALLTFTPLLVTLIENRQAVIRIEGKQAAQDLTNISKHISTIQSRIRAKDVKIEKSIAFRAVNTIQKLRSHLQEWFTFYKDYDPTFTWWVSAPYPTVDKALADLASSIREALVGIAPGDDDAIVGDPIGRSGLLYALENESIPYTPEELIKIGEHEYAWCETEMKKASCDLGFHDWRDGLEHVKNLYVEPGEMIYLVRDLLNEGNEYVKKHDLVSVPRIAEEAWTMYMMSPARQLVNPFFTGGHEITVSFPTSTMAHEDKLMSLRGNNIHFARATVFHEMIPGHHLQMHMNARYNSHRSDMFFTPFNIEGWAFYWECVLWDKEDWHKTPENRIGMLFWRMHRCARIIFSLKFHLGKMTPQECIDLLVDMVGHERATAEGEVRRSFNGDYSPLYQAGYMLGGLQLYSLRKEFVDEGVLSEKEFHDWFLKENQMPIELFRALLTGRELEREYKSTWKFYEGV